MRFMDWAYIQYPGRPFLDALRDLSLSFKRDVDLLDRYGMGSDLVDVSGNSSKWMGRGR